jgi:uncharacterized membrane protein
VGLTSWGGRLSAGFAFLLLGLYWFPLLQGKVFEGDLWRAGLLLAAGLALFHRERDRVWSTLDRWGESRRLLPALYVLLSSVWAGLALIRYYRIETTYLDFGIFTQAIRSLLDGRWFATTLAEGGGASYWSDHVNLWIGLFAPAYFTPYGNQILLVLQAFLLFSPGLLLSIALGRRGLPGRWRLLPFLMWSLQPTVGFNTLWDFHETPLGVVLLMYWGLALVERRGKAVLGGAIFLALLKETFAVYLLPGLLVFGFLEWRRTSSLRAVIPWLVAPLALVFWFVFVKSVFIDVDYFAPGLISTHRYAQFGSSGREVVIGILTRPGLVWETLTRPEVLNWYRDLLLPTGGMALLSVPGFLAWFPMSLVNALSERTIQMSPHAHYGVELYPLLVVVGVGTALQWRKQFQTEGQERAFLAFLLLAAAWHVGPSPVALTRTRWPGTLQCRSALNAGIEALRAHAKSCGGRENVLVFAASGWFGPVNEFPHLYPVDSVRRERPGLRALEASIRPECQVYLGPGPYEEHPGARPIGACFDKQNYFVRGYSASR